MSYIEVTTCSSDLFKDVVFVIDASGSIGSSRFQLIRDFTANITTELINSSPRSAVGVILFSTRARVEFNLQSHTNLSELLLAIDELPYLTGGTNTAGALRLLRFAAENELLGLRNGSSKIAIVITDGMSNRPIQTELAADELHSLNIFEIYAVGIGSADQTELGTIASSPEFVFFTPDFNIDGLEQIIDAILPPLCIGKYISFNTSYSYVSSYMSASTNTNLHIIHAKIEIYFWWNSLTNMNWVCITYLIISKHH